MPNYVEAMLTGQNVLLPHHSARLRHLRACTSGREETAATNHTGCADRNSPTVDIGIGLDPTVGPDIVTVPKRPHSRLDQLSHSTLGHTDPSSTIPVAVTCSPGWE